ncbi:glycoside hydrolase family 27 protein [Mycolicibacterium porcinum]|uniref:glycoside hydrolase family 27 protein n=1 Tax=Mycolicibacterium porcinum TaxID=39693 RepID=UPI001190D922|nr:glycoside hydrolase family 27 protein [Mycolicibacterium porcinum]TVX95710.1 glycoside hydrolase family 27 protein [Mycolicibacterium porcinum]
MLALTAVTVAVLPGCAPQDTVAIAAPPLPPMGWNSWNSGMELTEDSVRQTIDAMVSSGMRDAGYRYVNLDAGWAAPARDADGRLVADPDRFPNGLEPLVRYAHDRGLKFGLYSSPFNETCGQGRGTASLGHEAQDAATFAAWGVDYLKYDWCRDAVDHDEQVRVFGAMGKALRDSGRKIVYSINPNSSDDVTAGARYDWSGIADVVRSSGDLLPVWRYVLPPMGSNDPFNGAGFNGVPEQFSQAVADTAEHPYRADPDMLVVGVSWREFFDNHLQLMREQAQAGALNPDQLAALRPALALGPEVLRQLTATQPGLTEDEQRSHFSLWAMLGAPLLAGNDLRSMSSATREILTNREVIDIDQDVQLSRPHAVAGAPRIWARALADSSVAVAFFNNSDASVDLATTAHAAGLEPVPCYSVRDLWTHAESTTTGAITADSLAPHAVQLVRVRTGCTS